MVGVGGGSGLAMPESGVISLIFSCSLLVCLSHFLFYSLSYLLLLLFLSLSSSPLNQSISQHMFMETPFSDQCYWGVEESHDGSRLPACRRGA